MTTFKVGDIVIHKTFPKEYIGVIENIWDDVLYICFWKISSDNMIGPARYFSSIISLFPGDPDTIHPYLKNKSLSSTDSPLIRKIKELDLKWETRMKSKGTFYLTSRVPNVVPKTT